MPERTNEIEIPILHEIGERLYAAAVTADAQRTAVSRLRQRLLGTRGARGRLTVAVVALAVAGGAGGLALAGDLGAINPQAWVNGDRVAPAPRVTQAQDTSLGILRRAHLSSDALDGYDGRVFTHSPIAASGANIALARRAHGFKDGAAWVIPGNGVICLTAENAQGLREVNPDRPGAQLHHLPGAAGGGSCAATAIVEKGWSAGAASLEGSQGMSLTTAEREAGQRLAAVHVAKMEGDHLAATDHLLFSQSQMAPYKYVAIGLSQPAITGITSIPAAIEALLDQVAGDW